MIPENHRWVVGFLGQYSVCDCGHVYSHKWRSKPYRLKLNLLNSGYHSVKLRNGGTKYKHVTVHSIIAEAFHGPSGSLHVHHKDENRLNNAPDNLKYVTQLVNNIIATAKVHNMGYHGYRFEVYNLTGFCSKMGLHLTSLYRRTKSGKPMKCKGFSLFD